MIVDVEASQLPASQHAPSCWLVVLFLRAMRRNIVLRASFGTPGGLHHLPDAINWEQKNRENPPSQGDIRVLVFLVLCGRSHQYCSITSPVSKNKFFERILVVALRELEALRGIFFVTQPLPSRSTFIKRKDVHSKKHTIKRHPFDWHTVP